MARIRRTDQRYGRFWGFGGTVPVGDFLRSLLGRGLNGRSVPVRAACSAAVSGVGEDFVEVKSSLGHPQTHVLLSVKV